MKFPSERILLLAGALTGLLLPLLGVRAAITTIWLAIIWMILCGGVLYVLSGRIPRFLKQRNIAVGSTASLAAVLSSTSQIGTTAKLLVGALLGAISSVMFLAGLITAAMLVLFGHGR